MCLQTFLEKMTEKFFSVILTFLHLIISGFSLIKDTLLSLRRNYEEKCNMKSKEDEYQFVASQKKRFKKIPSHLAVIVGNDINSYRDLANITLWCLAAGISFVSFYDHKGILKKNEVELNKELTEITEVYTESIKWGRKRIASSITKNHGTTNGVSNSCRVCVNILSLDDGKEALVDLTKSLCHLVVNGQMKSGDITENLIDEKLQDNLGAPDPELAVYCGDTCSTFGFLPWQIRVTEFLQLRTLQNVQVKDFVSLLDRYGKCIQRLGK